MVRPIVIAQGIGIDSHLCERAAMITLVGRHTTGGPDALFSFSTGEYVSLVGYGNERERDPGPSGSARSATPMLTRTTQHLEPVQNRGE